MTEVIRLRDAGVTLAGRQVLHDIDLGVSKGEFLALLGPNGAGKTTMLRAMLGLVPATGTIEVDGKAAGRGRKDVGYVPQRHAINWNMPLSVEDVVVSGMTGRHGLFRRPSSDDFKAVFEAIDRVMLTDLRDCPIAELSGGQRQRVLVARALGLRPNILLLDEPFTGVDIPTGEMLLDLFQKLADESVAIVMTTHDLVSAVHTASRVCLVNKTIIADGEPEEVRSMELWQRAFGFRDDSPLLAGIGVA